MVIENLIYVKTLITKIFSQHIFKIVGTGVFLCGNFLFDSLLKEGMIALLVLIVFDSITAVGSAFKNGDEIKSSKVLRTAIKIAVYFLLISAGNLTEHGTNGLISFIDETILGFLAITELVSILENVGNMGYAIPKKLLNKLKQIQKTK